MGTRGSKYSFHLALPFQALQPKAGSFIRDLGVTAVEPLPNTVELSLLHSETQASFPQHHKPLTLQQHIIPPVPQASQVHVGVKAQKIPAWGSATSHHGCWVTLTEGCHTGRKPVSQAGLICPLALGKGKAVSLSSRPLATNAHENTDYDAMGALPRCVERQRLTENPNRTYQQESAAGRLLGSGE